MSARRMLGVGMLAVLVPVAATSTQPPHQAVTPFDDDERVSGAVKPVSAGADFDAVADDRFKYTPLFPGGAYSGFVGGATGQAQSETETATSATDPPVNCALWEGSHCHHPLPTWYFYSDQSTAYRAADDFVSNDPGPLVISDLCWWGVYADFYGNECSETVEVDQFTVTIYMDGGGFPGSSVDSSTFSSVLKQATGRYTPWEWPEFEYTGTLQSPIPISSGQCYWIEISNNLSTDCPWLWSYGEAGNQFAAQDWRWGNHDDYDNFYGGDLAFCINPTIASDDCGVVNGQCCDCTAQPPTCGVGTRYACGNTIAGTDWRVGGDCSGDPCARPTNDDCGVANETIDTGIVKEFDTLCATKDGPDTNCRIDTHDLDKDIWYEYTATCDGLLTVSLCGRNSYDSFIAIYGDGTSTCVCPEDNTYELACNDDDDDNCLSLAHWTSAEATVAAVDGACYTIRVGGIPGASGPGQIAITCTSIDPVYVDAAASGLNDGSSWCNAYQNLQDALLVADMGTPILVADGVYKPDQGGLWTPGDPAAAFQLGTGLTIEGGYAGCDDPAAARDIAKYVTTLSGDIGTPDDDADNSYHVVTGSGTNRTTVLDGLVITGGNADANGGGMLNVSGSPTLINCKFIGNSAASGNGGAMFNDSGSNPALTNCMFAANRARDGAAIANSDSSPTLTNCSLSGNLADLATGGIYNQGSSSPTVTNSILWENWDADGDDESAQIHGGTPTVTYSCIQGWTQGGTGNSFKYPSFYWPVVYQLFMYWGPATSWDWDLNLRVGSTSNDAGNNDAPGLSGITEDLAGNPRFDEDPKAWNTGNPGAQGPPIVDKGAYEGFPDCNFNEVPDDLDIAGPTSEDIDPDDDVPDECRPFIGNCLPPNEPNWSCCANWDLNTVPPCYPDDADPVNGVPNIHVKLNSGDQVLLDVPVTIPSLEIRNGAALFVPTAGALNFSDPAILMLEGFLRVGTNPVVGGTGVKQYFHVGPGGVLEAEPLPVAAAAAEAVSATIYASDVLVTAGDCVTSCDGGRIELTDSMSVIVENDLVLDGTGALPCQPEIAQGEGARGGRMPGIVKNKGPSTTLAAHNLILTGSSYFVNESLLPIELTGDFINMSTYPECFESVDGGMLFRGDSPQTFEVGGRDLGATQQGFNVGTDTNFAMGSVQVGTDTAGADVTFANEYMNTVGTAGGEEALYVHTLTLKANSIVTLEDCRVYYNTLNQEGNVTINLNGANAELVQLLPCSPAVAPPQPAGEAGYEKIRYISMEPGNPALLTALRVTLTTMPEPFDGLNDTKMWVGEPRLVSENAGKENHEPGWPDFMSANLQCDAYCMDWSTVGVLHVTDNDIVPGAVYDVQAIDCVCSFSEEASYSAPLTIATSRWGDLVRNCTTCPCGASDGTVGVPTDVTAALDKFKNLRPPSIPCEAVIKSRADVEPNFPDWLVNISDVTFVLDAFRGFAYPAARTPPAAGWPGPDGCP